MSYNRNWLAFLTDGRNEKKEQTDERGSLYSLEGIKDRIK